MSQTPSELPPWLSDDRRPRRQHDHNMPFLDHRGNKAIMSWHNNSAEDPGLPPLWCWAFYFTDAKFDFSMEAFDGAKFKRGLFNRVGEAAFMDERFEFYYLPGATPEDCVEHYRAELEKRGTVWEDLERLRVRSSSRRGLPGLVPEYADKNDVMTLYQGAVFMSEDADWDPEHNGRKLCLVQFDPVPQHYEPDEKIYSTLWSTPFIPNGWMLLKVSLTGSRIAAGPAAQTNFWIRHQRTRKLPGWVGTHGSL